MYCCWLVLELVLLYFFVIETKNRTLEETSALFDGEEATQLRGVGVADLIPSAEKDVKNSGSLLEHVDIPTLH